MNRQCTMCKKVKPLNLFYKTKYRCMKCMKPIYKKRMRDTKESQDLEDRIEEMLSDYIEIKNI